MACRRLHQLGRPRGPVGRLAELGQRLGRQVGARGLVAARPRVVDGVVEPGREPHGVGIVDLHGGDQVVDRAQHAHDVGQPVVAPVGFAVAGQQARQRRVGGAARAGERRPPIAQLLLHGAMMAAWCWSTSVGGGSAAGSGATW